MRMIRTNYHYPPELIQQLKEASAETGIPMAEIIRRAIRVWLKMRQPGIALPPLPSTQKRAA